MEHSPADSHEKLLYEGRHLSLKQRGSWEYVERRGRAGGVMIVAVTAEDELLLVEEYRPPVAANVISLPAGLVGDEGAAEDPAEAAARELREETGYEAAQLEFLGGGPSSPGLAAETVLFYRAHPVRRAGDPTAQEEIRLHAVALRSVREWTRRRNREGAVIHPLLWAGLYLAFPPGSSA
jgi:ADP-ribose pyrophosphatase